VDRKELANNLAQLPCALGDALFLNYRSLIILAAKGDAHRPRH
jgi:hypothetical protein